MHASQTTLTGASPAQQLDVLRVHTDLRAKAYYGGVARDGWTLERWRHEVDTHHVLVMTPAVFKAALTHGFMTVTPLLRAATWYTQAALAHSTLAGVELHGLTAHPCAVHACFSRPWYKAGGQAVLPCWHTCLAAWVSPLIFC
jgi:hypothetical protein